jgi:hypothetical protein
LTGGFYGAGEESADEQCSMASKSGRAGVKTREMAERRALIRAGFGLIAMIVGWVFLKVMPHAQAAGIGTIVVLFVAFKVAMNILESKIDTKIVEEKRAIRGAVAEEKIEEILDQLDDEHFILHDVVSSFGNIDHVVLSKNHGLFLIETKSHGGTVTVVDGKIRVNGNWPEKDFISQTIKNTYWLAEQLRLITGVTAWVSPSIVFTNAFVERSRPIKGITVTNKKFLLSNIQQNRKPLPAEIWDARETIADRFNGGRKN